MDEKAGERGRKASGFSKDLLKLMDDLRLCDKALMLWTGAEKLGGVCKQGLSVNVMPMSKRKQRKEVK